MCEAWGLNSAALPFYTKAKTRSSAFRSIQKILFWFFFANCIILGWIGGKNIEPPFYLIGQIATFFYFFYLICVIPGIVFIENILWNKK